MIGDRIKAYRIEKDMSLSELSQRAGIAKSYLSSIERNIQSNPSVQLLEKLANELDVTVHDLIGGNPHKLDEEWYSLLKSAIQRGITKENFREYINRKRSYS
ncbi:helix-turn-helix domain-containing protein [Bacillus sp. HMF5848]|uniref:helix-turn-helix domain-containing protein n=1 Tax=Bacillus sp. HMF5848 TaxID=2495421 RepID=UPI000F7AC517|nr:helix-turn-helix domain-containing protein [Bacillus sp. HMF5848]